jgi:hypothetical protein
MEEKGIYEKKTSAFDDLVDKMEAFKPDLIAMSTVEDTFLRGISLLEYISHYKIPSVACCSKAKDILRFTAQDDLPKGLVEVVRLRKDL